MPRHWAALAYGALAAYLALSAPPARADAVAEFYRGRTVTLVVGYGPGRRLRRLCAARRPPSRPPHSRQSHRRGAEHAGRGLLRAVNWLYNSAPKDGTALAHFARNMPLMGMLGTNPNMQFDPRRFTWLGSSSSFANDAYILIVRTDTPVKTIDDARRPAASRWCSAAPPRARPATTCRSSCATPSASTSSRSSAIPTAARCTSRWSAARCTAAPSICPRCGRIKPDWLKPDSGYQVLVQFARATRHPDFPDVPTARELARNEAARALIELDRNALQAVAPVRGAARGAGRARQGAAARRSPQPIRIRTIWRRPEAAHRREPGHRRGGGARAQDGSRTRRRSCSTISGGCSPKARAEHPTSSQWSHGFAAEPRSIGRTIALTGRTKCTRDGRAGCIRRARARRRRPTTSPISTGASAINLIVSYGPGGGYDVYARVLASHMSRHIPGNPNIVVQNMPGAGSLRGANYIYNVAPKDGTVFGTFARNMALIGLLKTNQNVQFDPAKFTWLGSSSTLANDAYMLIVRRDAKVKSVEDARRAGGPPIILGSTAEGTSSDAMGILLREWLGFNVKVIPGYTDSGVLFLAIERGEVEGRTVGLSSVKRQQAGLAQAERACARAGGVRARHALSGIPGCADRARTRQERRGPQPDRDPGNSLCAVAALCGAARRAGRSRQGAAGRLHGDPQGPRLSRGSREDSASR